MRLDLHFHTTVSDGTASGEVMVSMIHKRGLDGFSITDHDNPGDPDKYRELAQQYNLLYISGMEITSEKGHLLVYTLPETADVLYEFEPNHPVQFYVEKARDLDVILAPAHPFDYLRHGMGDEIFNYFWSALETYNGSTVFPFSNRRAEKAARRLSIPEVGGSDAHTKYYVGLTYTEASASTPEEFLDKIKKGETFVGGSHLNAFQFSRRILVSKIFK